ncbi:MAG: hypothetical protein LBF58_02580, partial [Deltaproteobacteria bacterium]|nr:hypothetical protein [Deltaproteobacteria bacterium]
PAVPVTPADPPAVPVTPAVAPGADSPAVPVTPAALTEDKPAACQEMPSWKSPFWVDNSKAGGAICGQPAPVEATGAAADKPADAAGTQTATVAVTPPAAKPPTREEVMALLRADPPIDTPRLEQALGLLENNPGSEDDVFLLVRVLSKRDPKYKIRLGAFFDPTDGRGKGEVIPNVKYAYDEYNDSGLPEAKELIARLVTWSKTAEAANADGLEEFKAAIN